MSSSSAQFPPPSRSDTIHMLVQLSVARRVGKGQKNKKEKRKEKH